MPREELSIEEAEKLSYYDFMGYLGTPFFQIGGLRSTEELAGLCGIDKDKYVLVVGCGTGFNACHIAKTFGCRLVGVDIAEEAIKKAGERAEKEGLQDRVEFKVGDAYALPFEPDTFDAAITQFVSQFLDMGKALKEFKRVLKKGGSVGINKIFKDSEMPSTTADRISEVEEMLADITGLPFTIHTPHDWKESLERAGLKDVRIKENKEPMGLREGMEAIGQMGGYRKLLRLLIRMTKYMVLSKEIRGRFMKLDKAKKVLVGYPLLQTETSKHVGYVLGTGKKG